MPDTSQKPPVYLLDSMSFIFRAYHAMQRQRPMSTRTGVPTAAVYVFVNMINKLRRDFAPEYFAAVFDTSSPVFRDEKAREIGTVQKFNNKTQQFEQTEYGGYKANRTAMPPDLAQQLPYIRRALEAFRIPILQLDGFEADDVIGTLAVKSARAGHCVYIVSNDKDMMQLVSEDIRILNPQKDNLLLDRDKVLETMGVPPEKIVDVMALRGDAIDNIPGAPGIGDKGSVELIQQFGSIQAVLENADAVKRKTYRESLQNNRRAVELSKELATIDTRAEIDLDLEAMRTREPDLQACRALFGELEFTTLLKELAVSGEESGVELLPEPTEQQLQAFFESAKTHGFALALDTLPMEAAAEQVSAEETEESDSEPAQATMSLLQVVETAERKHMAENRQHCVGVAAEGGIALRIALESQPGQRLRGLLEDESVPKSVHDLKAALRVLSQHGIALTGVRHDAMLYSYLVNPTHTTHRLADVVARFSPAPLKETGERMLPEQAWAIHSLAPMLRSDVETLGAESAYSSIDLPLCPVLWRMEEAGVRIDRGALARMDDRLTGELARVSEEIYELAGCRFNIGSPRQLGDVLFNRMKLAKPVKYGKGRVISTAQDVLEGLADKSPVAGKVLEYRQIAKLKSNYIDSLPGLADENGRVHTTFNQVGTATGRLSSTNPNLQNIPVKTEMGREIRAAFIAAPGRVLLSADYSQIELRLMAHFSEDPLLVRAYRTGEDIHTLTAAEVFGVPAEGMSKEVRNRAKAVNFGIVYGISPFGLSAQLGIDQNEARLYIERYFERYQGVRAYIDRVLEQTRREQRVHTLFGRVRPIPDIQSRNSNMRGFAERTAVNTPLQGTAADMIKVAMIRIDRRLREERLETWMTLQVHDELLFDAPEDEVERVRTLVKQEMEGVIELKVPIVADVATGANWRDLQ